MSLTTIKQFAITLRLTKVAPIIICSRLCCEEVGFCLKCQGVALRSDAKIDVACHVPSVGAPHTPVQAPIFF